jgi:DNA-binding NtrC family response regulator
MALARPLPRNVVAACFATARSNMKRVGVYYSSSSPPALEFAQIVDAGGVRCSGELEMPQRMPTILVADDDAAMREVLEMRLQEWGFSVLVAEDGDEALQIAESKSPDIVLADLVMPQVSGLELLRRLKSDDKYMPVILITAEGNVDVAVEAMKRGAEDFVTKPLDYPKLRAILEAARREMELRGISERLNSQLDRGSGLGDFVGNSKPMREVYDLIRSLSISDTPVIITGESGCGKELAAKTIHLQSSRARGPFIAINAAAIPETLMESEIFGHEKGAFTGAVSTRPGCFELAHRGTLFLDEIAEMPPALQPKLLRIIEDQRVRRLGGSQEIPVDVRVIAATNREPRSAVHGGKLRDDLYYRLSVFTICLPPLRERAGDIPLLIQHFIRECSRKHNIQILGARQETTQLLKSYSWPGNVRELRNVVERAVILARGGWIEPSHLPAYMTSVDDALTSRIVLPPRTTLADAEKEILQRTLQDSGNNKAEAARRLGVDVKTIRNKLKSYGLDDQ